MLHRDLLNQECYEKIYSEGRELLRYPDETLVSYFYKSINSDDSINKILDVGCGAGRHMIFFAERGYDTAGIETSQHAVDFVKKLGKETDLELNIKKGSANDLDFKDNSFDLLLCWGVVNNLIDELDDSMKEFKRVLCPNGKLLISLMSPEDIKYQQGTNVADNIYQIEYEGSEYYTRFWTRKTALNLMKDYSFKTEKIGFVKRCQNFDEHIPIAYYTIAAKNI